MLRNFNLVYKIVVIVGAPLTLYIYITTEHHTSQYSSYRALLQRECLTFKWYIPLYIWIRKFIHVAKPQHIFSVFYGTLICCLCLKKHFNNIFPPTIAGFKYFVFHLGSILKFCKQFLFLHTTLSTKFIFLYLMRLRICIKTEYKNITCANKYLMINGAFYHQIFCVHCKML